MKAATDTTVQDGTAFVDAVRRSGLIGVPKLDRALKSIPIERTSAEDIAKRFVSHGFLTAFQVKRLLAGKTDGFIIGPYVILEPLGGGKGTIYRARHRSMNRIVAIKLLAPDRAHSASLRDAFQSATRAAVQLLHPNIVATFDANQCGRCLYAVLEYATGRDLGEFVRDHSPLPVRTACGIAHQVALALAHAHGRGVYHGLLNPNNVLVGEPDASSIPAIKVLNFGYGRLAAHYANDETRQLDGALAIAEHLAPEAFDPKTETGPAADLFSLGCLFHVLLTGRPPSGDRPIHQFSNRTGVERWRPGLASELLELVRELLAQDPGARPDSARSVADRLERLSRGQGGDELALAGAGDEINRSGSPFESLDTVTDLSLSNTVEVLAAAREREPQWSIFGSTALAAVVILATAAAVALVLRSVVH